MAQLQWIHDHLADIESDMSAFHRVDDIWSMPARKFFPFAFRLAAYQGVMQARAIEAEREAQPAPPPRSQGDWPAPAASGQRREVPATKVALQNDPVFGGLISFG